MTGITFTYVSEAGMSMLAPGLPLARRSLERQTFPGGVRYVFSVVRWRHVRQYRNLREKKSPPGEKVPAGAGGRSYRSTSATASSRGASPRK